MFKRNLTVYFKACLCLSINDECARTLYYTFCSKMWLFFVNFEFHQERRYICFDGDLDPMYIENMKTIMDNSKMLTLGNGECIRLENHCAILFEVRKTKLKQNFLKFKMLFYVHVHHLFWITWFNKYFMEWIDNILYRHFEMDRFLVFFLPPFQCLWLNKIMWFLLLLLLPMTSFTKTSM